MVDAGHVAEEKSLSVKEQIEQKLTGAFAPRSLKVVDDSDKHAGHAGARPGGETHFRVHMVCDAFARMSRLERQRAVFAVLADEMAGPVHALQLRLSSSEEA